MLGHDVVRAARRVRRAINATGQYASVDEALTGRENLVMVARLLGADRRTADRRARELLDHFDLTDAADHRCGGYSGGMRRRPDLAASLVGSPPVVFLDEPTTGVDTRSRQALWHTITGLAEHGTTVFLAIETLRELTSGAPVGDQVTALVLWMSGLTVAALVLTQWLFQRAGRR